MELTHEAPKIETHFPDNLPVGWRSRLAGEKDKDYFKKLSQFLVRETRNRQRIFPPQHQRLRALQELDFEDVKVVILGQDPYHGPGQAVGFSFAVPNELRPKPPSLQNIFKEIASDLGVDMSGKSSELSGWVEQGVLLLNTILTVRAHTAFSHRDKGWENFTDQVIRRLNERERPVIFLLWGAAAQKKKALLSNPRHFVLESAHPSPLSAHRGFLGSKPFSKINRILASLGSEPIDWTRTEAQA